MKTKIVVLGMMSRHPVAGMVFITLQYLIGLQRLGYDVFYVEPQGGVPGTDPVAAPAWIDSTMRRFHLGDRWAYHSIYGDGRCYGLSERQLKDLYQSAALIINLHGATKPSPELTATGRLVYLETDPVELEISLFNHEQWAYDLWSQHCAFFTWGENCGQPDCRLPSANGFHFVPTRQPVVIDLWETFADCDGEAFTTIGNLRQEYREVEFLGETYYWSKHYEFLKFIDLPSRTGERFELALSSCEPSDRELLEAKGWRVVPAADYSIDIDAYRQYIGRSRGEFTVAKDQNVRLRTGWFSDRGATYLAAGRPVINQETGFSNTYPVGEGLFAFSTIDDAVAAVETVAADYERHRRAARSVAREYFSYDVVLPAMLSHVGM
jgi:hypothetical protein